MYNVTLIPGDGTGPELAEATRKCLDATGVKINWDVQECGIEVIEAQGKIPDSVFTSIRANKIALKAPITTPIGKGFRSVNVALRQELGLYACVRPCKTYKGVRSYTRRRKSIWSSSARTPKTSTPVSSSKPETPRPPN